MTHQWQVAKNIDRMKFNYQKKRNNIYWLKIGSSVLVIESDMFLDMSMNSNDVYRYNFVIKSRLNILAEIESRQDSGEMNW